MSTSYFANAVFGIELGADVEDAVNEKWAEFVVADDDLDAVEVEEKVRKWAAKSGLLAKLSKEYAAPKGATLFYTGDSDERPGSCDVEAEIWVFGVGLLGVPGLKMSKKFLKDAAWRTWVEAS